MVTDRVLKMRTPPHRLFNQSFDYDPTLYEVSYSISLIDEFGNVIVCAFTDDCVFNYNYLYTPLIWRIWPNIVHAQYNNTANIGIVPMRAGAFQESVQKLLKKLQVRISHIIKPN